MQLRHPREAAHADELVHGGYCMGITNNKFTISLFFRTVGEPKVLLAMFIYSRPLFPVAAALVLLLLLAALSIMSGGG